MSAEMQPIPQGESIPYPIERVRPPASSIDAFHTDIPDNVRSLWGSKSVRGEEHPREDIPKTEERTKGKRLGTDAFNLEYEKAATKRNIRTDILTYLLEYRLKVQEYSYKYTYGKGEKGEGNTELRTDGERKSVFQMTKRTIKEREERGLPTHREEAEKKGAQTINKKLQTAEEGDILLWASPPGPKSEGYGDYGFLFVGVVAQSEEKDAQQGDRTVYMKAIRLEKPTIEQYNTAWSQLCGIETKDQQADFFLASPTIRKLAPDVVRQTLQETFTFTVDPKKHKIAEQVLKDADRLIHTLEKAIQTGTDTEKLEAFRAVENYTIERQAYYEKNGLDEKKPPRETRSTQQLTASYGSYAPPAAQGSCGASNMVGGGGNMFSMGMESSSGSESSDAIVTVKTGRSSDPEKMPLWELKSKYSVHDRYEERYFKCPNERCGVYNVRPYGELIPTCYACNNSVSCESSDVAA